MTALTDVADAVAAAATSVTGVTALSPGRFGEIATYGPGRRVSGVRLSDQGGEVHIEVSLVRNLLDVAEEVRVAAEKAAGRPMTVVVEDVSMDNDTPTTPADSQDTV
ncbi:hypothetical protein [Williamsia sp. CHRR-6]|uniref:hypothetical protein n=1 Tax=Williamsia sp. CHRR-6 TaxID=2835871 RepID=UPI001BDABC3B|nr:hypothetical protein [Williamsia sp. CHRR-6]MBT0567305.1 hypothetical protein [Williamsia sp. CHRR-6]